MAGNTFGGLFRVTTWGESHGAALGVIIDGCPAGLDLKKNDIQQALDRRRPVSPEASTPRRESDRVEILSGVFGGKTTGTPIALLIRNSHIRTSDYAYLKNIFRPGHGDFTYLQKYGIRDWRGGGRSSGRETAARVAAGAVAEKLIGTSGIEVLAFTRAIGAIEIRRDKVAAGVSLRRKVRGSVLFCPDATAAAAMKEELASARAEGDSLGGVVEVIVSGCLTGLGEPVFDKIDADLAKALMSIGSVKAVEVGDGCAAAKMRGSQFNDQMDKNGFKTNHAGGILAGITTGREIILRVYCKPVPSIAKTQQTLDVSGQVRKIEIRGRHDTCVLPRIVPVCEAMVSLVLADHLLRQGAAQL